MELGVESKVLLYTPMLGRLVSRWVVILGLDRVGRLSNRLDPESIHSGQRLDRWVEVIADQTLGLVKAIAHLVRTMEAIGMMAVIMIPMMMTTDRVAVILTAQGVVEVVSVGTPLVDPLVVAAEVVRGEVGVMSQTIHLTRTDQFCASQGKEVTVEMMEIFPVR